MTVIRKRLKISTILLALIVAFSMIVPSAVASAEGNDSNIFRGTAKVSEFGGYDVNVEVNVENDKINEVNIEGTNYKGSHGEVNKGYLMSAAEGMKDKFKGLSVKDASKIYNVDGVSGSTLSSNTIKKAVLNALNLELPQDNKQLTPKEDPSQGVYTIDISNITERVLGSDKESPVRHSILKTDIQKAKLIVEKDGKMKLSYDVEPGKGMYVLDYLGYFNNDGSNDSNKIQKSELKKDVVSEKKTCEDIKDITPQIVNKVTRPLDKQEAKNSDHFDCFEVYVPVMSQMPGFEKGFKVVTKLNLYWNTLNKVSTGTTNNKPTKKVNLKAGNYVVKASMTTPDGSNSMSNKALNKDVKLRVSGGKYYIAPEFNKMNTGGSYGYLGKIWYFDSGFKADGSVIKGKVKPVKILEYHKDKKGKIIKDKYGKNYPKKVEFQLIPEALVDGRVPVQVTIPIMDSLIPGSGTKQAIIKIDWKSAKKIVVKKPKKIIPKKMKLKAKVQKKRKVKLTWGKNKKASGFVLYMATSKNGKFKVIKTLKGSKYVKWTKTKLKAKKKYYFMIKAFKYQKGKKVFIAISPKMMVKVIK